MGVLRDGSMGRDFYESGKEANALVSQAVQLTISLAEKEYNSYAERIRSINIVILIIGIASGIFSVFAGGGWIALGIAFIVFTIVGVVKLTEAKQVRLNQLQRIVEQTRDALRNTKLDG